VYTIISCFQIVCIIITGGCAYLISQNKTLKETRGRDTWLLTAGSIFITQCGYALYLQAVSLEGLQIARKVYLIAGVAALAFWIVTVASENSRVKIAVTIGALIAACFIGIDSLDRYLFRDAQLKQNQYFYYIEESKQTLYYAGRWILSVLLAGMVISILLKKTQIRIFQGTSRIWFAVATLLPCMILVLGDLAAPKQYPMMIPALTAACIFAVTGLYKEDKK